MGFFGIRKVFGRRSRLGMGGLWPSWGRNGRGILSRFGLRCTGFGWLGYRREHRWFYQFGPGFRDFDFLQHLPESQGTRYYCRHGNQDNGDIEPGF